MASSADVVFCPAADRREPTSADNSTAWVNHAPIDREAPACRRVGGKDTRFGRNDGACTTIGHDSKVHGGQCVPRLRHRLETIGRSYPRSFPGRADERADHQLVSGTRQDRKMCACSTSAVVGQERLNAFGTTSANDDQRQVLRRELSALRPGCWYTVWRAALADVVR